MPFPEREQVRLEEVMAELEKVASELEVDPDVIADFKALAKDHQLPIAEATFRDYARVRLAFEATRDGGLWNLRWTITDREPRSNAIWEQWRKQLPKEQAVSADAECDELSALFAFVARRLGVRHVGLFWPQANHVVAAWTVDAKPKPVRVVVPTSQIFLGADDTLGTRGFDPYTQRTIYDYVRVDAANDALLPVDLARFLVQWAQLAGKPARPTIQLRDVLATGFDANDFINRRAAFNVKPNAIGFSMA